MTSLKLNQRKVALNEQKSMEILEQILKKNQI